MPRDLVDVPSAPPMRVAVIGSGVAGLAAAWLASCAHRVTLYEQDPRVGGHAHTVDVPGPDGPIAVDTGFIVYNERNYPNLVRLFQTLGVPTRPSPMSFAVSLDDGALEYAGSSLAGLFGQRRNLLRPRFWRMLADVLRFYRHGPSLLAEAGSDGLSLGAYLQREGYSAAFIDDHLLPMGAAIWSTSVQQMRDHPASAFVRFSVNHGLMQIAGRPQWRTVCGGSRAYVQRLSAPFAAGIRTATAVRSIRRSAGQVVIEDSRGGIEAFDHAIVASHADQALAMLADASAREQAVLGAFRYTRNVAVLHGDAALMPTRRRVWASWNYLGVRGGGGAQLSVTYWMNSLQSLDPRVPLFVTLNPHREPAGHLVYREFVYEHPLYDAAALRAQRDLEGIQGSGNVWFCGSYFGAGFHEDALASGLAAAERATGLRRPWADGAVLPDGSLLPARAVA